MIIFLLSWVVCGLVGGLITNHYDTKHMNDWVREDNTYFHIEPMWLTLGVSLSSGYTMLIYSFYVIYMENLNNDK